MASLAELLKNLTPEQNQYVARLVASLPQQYGGLDLPLNNTAIDRANLLGFDTNKILYHGTPYDVAELNVQGKGKTKGAGVFLTNNPLVAETYVPGFGGANIMPLMMRKENIIETNAKGRNWNDINTNDLYANRKRLTDIFELEPNDVTSTDELGFLAGDAGYKGITIKNVKDIGPNSHVFHVNEYLKNKYGIVPDETLSNVTGKQFAEAQDHVKKMYDKQKSEVTALHDPSLLRSRFAAFNPWRKNEANVLASHPAATLMVSGGLTGMARNALNKRYDPSNQYAQYGMESPVTYGDIASSVIGALPGYGEVLTAAQLADLASKADWKKTKRSIVDLLK